MRGLKVIVKYPAQTKVLHPAFPPGCGAQAASGKSHATATQDERVGRGAVHPDVKLSAAPAPGDAARNAAGGVTGSALPRYRIRATQRRPHPGPNASPAVGDQPERRGHCLTCVLGEGPSKPEP